MTSIIHINAAVTIDEEVRLNVGDVEYILIPHEKPFPGFRTEDYYSPMLFVVYQAPFLRYITRKDLRRFFTDVLYKDDVYQPAFSIHIVFNGCNSNCDLLMDPDAKKELQILGTENSTPMHQYDIPPGPYVYWKGQTWQPWRIHYDSNAAFMCSFKPSPDRPGG